ncbi:MAG: carboxymuconolactone decarboxylase family protein [Pirellulales bacterium]|nr:carboxymuconolactone decarboxylase family protein [Pirellulales bacterium]
MATPRLNYLPFVSSQIHHLNEIETLIAHSSLDPTLLELVKLRVSQINGCSFCVRYHTQLLRKLDESHERIDLVAVWRESPCFSNQERTALAWAEAVTQLAGGEGINDELYAQTLQAFGEEGISQLTLAVAMINIWNRLAVPFRTDHKYISDLLAHASSTC